MSGDLSVPGFRAAGLACGIKPSGAPDLALIACDGLASAAGVFTRSSVVGAPVEWSRTQVRKGRVRAIVVNSGVSNAGMGAQGARDTLAVGVFFFNPHHVSGGMTITEAALHQQGLQVAAWRDEPVDPDVLGDQARLTMPRIVQAIITPQAGSQHSALSTQSEHFELHLYLARKEFERETKRAGIEVYVPSLSSRTIVYKGLLLAPQIREFYADLNDDDFEVLLIVFHQRYSTNTFPTWARAQPFRVLCHNGEINTLQGNLA